MSLLNSRHTQDCTRVLSNGVFTVCRNGAATPATSPQPSSRPAITSRPAARDAALPQPGRWYEAQHTAAMSNRRQRAYQYHDRCWHSHPIRSAFTIVACCGVPALVVCQP